MKRTTLLESKPLRMGVLCGIVILSAALGFYKLGSKSIWLDEAASFWRAQLSWRSLAVLITHFDAAMPLYYLLLHMWVHVGHSEFAIRSLSVILGVGAVPLMYLVGADLFGRGQGLLAATILATNQFFVHYLQEARGYSLVVTLVVLATWLFVRAVKQPSVRRWILYGVAGTCAVWAHVFALLVVIGHAVSILFIARDRRLVRAAAVTFGCVILFGLPAALFVARETGSGTFQWIPALSVRQVAVVLGGLTGGLALLAVYVVLGGFGVAAAIRVWRRSGLSESSWRYGVVTTWLAVPLFLALAASVVQPVLISRYLIVILPAFVLLVVLGLFSINIRWLTPLGALILAILTIVSLTEWYGDGGIENWRATAKFVLSRTTSNDALVFPEPSVAAPFAYYVELMNGRDRAPRFIYPRWAITRLEHTRPPLSTLARRVDKPHDPYRRLWLVTSRVTGIPIVEARIDWIERRVKELYRPVDSQRFRGIKVTLYRRSRST